MLALKHRTASVIALLGSLVASAAVSGCAGQKPAAAQSGQPAATASAGDLPEVLATIGDEKITMAEIRSQAGEDLDQLEGRYRRAQYKLVESALQQVLRDRVLMAEAKKQNKTVDQLVEAEAGGSLEPTDVEVQAWYDQNKARTNGRTLTQVRTQIVDMLRKQKHSAALEKLNERLYQEQRVTVELEPYRATLNNEGAPMAGKANSSVTLVEFSDFQCPFCGRFFPTLKQVEKDYGDRIRIVYRQYPIPSLHPNAFKAAEASLCANAQGKFWEMHDLMFQEQNQLAVKELKLKASRLGLDQKKFDSCLDTGHYTEQVQEDMKEGSRNGVTGTPALFLNGVMLDGGAVPYEVVAKAIDQALARAKP